MLLDITEIKVKIVSLSDIQTDRFHGQEKDTRPPEQKLYLGPRNEVVFPSENIYAFLFGETPMGCARAFEGKRGKEYLRIGQAHTILEPALIPFTKNGKPLVFKDFTNGDFYISEYAPRTKSGSLSIKQDIRKRPVLRSPWELAFTVKLIKNALIDETRLYNWLMRGGIEIGLGNYRPRFGRFMVESFDIGVA